MSITTNNNQTEIFSYKDHHNQLNAYWQHYANLPAHEQRMMITNAYNIICVLPLVLPHEMNDLLDFYDEFKTYKQILKFI